MWVVWCVFVFFFFVDGGAGGGGGGASGGFFFFFFSKTGVLGGVCGESFPTSFALKISRIVVSVVRGGFWLVWGRTGGWRMKTYAICF